MNNKKFKTYWLICISFTLALVCTIVPLPNGIAWLRPHWLTLILIYWIMFSPNMVGVVYGFVAGIALDLLGGLLLGSTGFVLALVAFLTIMLKPKLRQIGFWQQLVIVIFLVSFEQLMSLWLQMFLGRSVVWTGYWFATVVSIIVWPLLFALLQSCQRKLQLL